MAKALSEMTLEELWRLFPIVLTAHRPQWKDWAKEEIENLHSLLSEHNPVISHIGSSAIAGIKAKPIIDILVEVPPTASLTAIRTSLENVGYICMCVSGTRMSLNKGYTPAGYAERVFHIHIHPAGDNAEIAFRDYLNSHPAVAREYESLKLRLLEEFGNNRDGYTAAKSEFVNRVITQASLSAMSASTRDVNSPAGRS